MQKIKLKNNLEFIALMASLMSMVALSIDAILPALNIIAQDLKFPNANDNQLLISMIFLGLGFGQLISGPLSDSFGRKPVIYVGFIVFTLASIICITTESLEIMVLGRILQGVGLSAPRTVSMAIVRDSFSGDYMAKVMSFIAAIFILVPIVAPTFGKLILSILGWRWIFLIQLIFVLIVLVWFWKRQNETLKPEHKVPFSVGLFINGTREFFKYKSSVIFTILSGFISGAFIVYLSTAQQIFEDQYNLVNEFPFIFAGLAFFVGVSTLFNGNFVLKFGMNKMVLWALVAFTIVPLLYVGLFYNQKNPNIVIFLIFMSLQFLTLGFIFGNLRALALDPIGHIAGVGSAINGFVSTVMAVPIAFCVGSFIKDTSLPLFIGFFVFGLISLLLLFFVPNKK